VTRETAPADAILLVDGVFLYRPELNDLWDFGIFVDIDFDLVLERGSQRDQAWMDSLAAAEDRYRNRYIPGEKLYLAAVRPTSTPTSLSTTETSPTPGCALVETALTD
jgi:uridine kinase